MAMTSSAARRVQRFPRPLGLALLCLWAAPLGARTFGADAVATAPAFDQAGFLGELQRRLDRAAAGPEASQSRLRAAGERLVGEMLGEWQRAWLRARGGSAEGLDAATARQLARERTQLEQHLKLLLGERLAETAARLAPPLPPRADWDAATAPVRASGVVTSATGAISGAVTGPVAVSGWIYVYDSAGYYLTRATISSGTWLASGLATGTYYVKTVNASGLIDKAWNGQTCPFYNPNPKTDCAATPISVTDGVTTGGIDFSLVAGGRVAGTVTASATSASIPGVLVWVVDGQGRNRAYSYTVANGVYTSYQGLPSGTYYVETASSAPAPGFLDEGYDNVPCEPSCSAVGLTPVTVTSPVTTTGINFALDAGGAISGTVTDQATALPLSGVSVYVYTDTGTYAAGMTSAADGTYAVVGLPTGTYKAYTANSAGYINEVWNDHLCVSYCDSAVGEPISVTVGSTTGGINFALVKGGSISGRVTRSDTAAGVAGVSVSIGFDDGGGSITYRSYVTTDASGNYAFSGLAPVDYYVWTSAADAGLNLLDEVHAGVPCPGCTFWWIPWDLDYRAGTAVTVSPGTTSSGIDFALDPGGQISGTVTRAGGGTPVSGTVYVYSATGFKQAATASIASGTYTAAGLPSGRYVVEAHGSTGELPRLYDNLPLEQASAASPIDVTAGTTTPGINFVLPVAGRIAGTITRADTGLPLANATVAVWGASGNQRSAAYTDAGGHYSTQDGLPTGAYTVLAVPPSAAADLSPRLYKTIDCLSVYYYSSADCDVTAADRVAVTAPNTTAGIDFALPVAGSISGTVVDAATSLGIQNLIVSATVVTASGSPVTKSVSTGASGAYALSGLPPAGYYVKVDARSTGYVDKVYNNVTCAGCDVRTGQRVDVRAGLATAGVNFVLGRGGSIGGTVSRAGVAVVGNVRAYTAAGLVVREIAATGSYTITGLPTGSYRVATFPYGSADGQLYNGIPCPGQPCDATTGTPVSVAAPGTTAGIDFVLPATGSITGFVRDAAGHPAWGGYVFGFNGGFGTVQLDGHYRMSDLTVGSHYVGTSVSELVNEAYDNVPCYGCDPAASGASAVAVVGGGITGGVDFTLDAGASINGTVMSAGRPLGGVQVRLKKSDAPFVYSAARTAEDGTYRVPGLPPGTYYATAVREGYDVQLYHDLPCPGACDLATGTPITVSGSGAVTGIDFSLAVRSLAFFTLPPCRLFDTRDAVGGLGGPALACPGDRSFPAAGSCGVPFDAKALSLNITSTGSTAQGHVRLHAGRSAAPTASSLNYTAGLTRANNAIVPLGTIGEIGIYCGQGSGTTHAILDVNGYFK